MQPLLLEGLAIAAGAAFVGWAGKKAYDKWFKPKRSNGPARPAYDRFQETIRNRTGTASYRQALEDVRSYFRIYPSAFRHGYDLNVRRTTDPGEHADTGGGYYGTRDRTTGLIDDPTWEGRPDVKFGTAYIKRAYRGDKYGRHEDFAKLVRSMQHESEHVEQRYDYEFMRTTTRSEREFLAYSSELLEHPNLPRLTGDHLADTLNKALDEYFDMDWDRQRKYRRIYDELRNIELGARGAVGVAI